MRGRAEAIDADALRIARHRERAIADESRAQERRRFDIRIALRQVQAIARIGDDTFRIARRRSYSP
jgi:hypothetical protein